MADRVIVCGGRHYTDALVVYFALCRFRGTDTIIVHGDASGADSLADREARELGLAVEPHPANWKQHGRAAGPIRNQEMIDAGAKEVIAFPGHAGTADCIQRAQRAGIPVSYRGWKGSE